MPGWGQHLQRYYRSSVSDGPLDLLKRPVKDLRISVTDRCNFRCTYCMPKEIFSRDHEFLETDLLLDFEEMTRLTRLFAARGVSKVRITGGEPLLRKGLEDLISELATVPGIDDLTLTTNGALLARKARGLFESGLDRVTVSLDSMDDAVFMAINDVGFPVQRVLEGVAEAARVGLDPIKINMVVKRGLNDGSIVSMARHFRGTGHILRFIEFMDVGTTNGWCLDDVVPSKEVVSRIHAAFPLQPIEANYTGEVARRYRYLDGQGEIGVIASVTQPFCGDCTRVRLSADGKLYTCLFASKGTDLRALIRSGADDAQLGGVIDSVWTQRSDRYSELRSGDTDGLDKVEMSYIGG